MVARFGLGAASQVVEVASNDGYLLQYFTARGVPVLGVEPAANVAAVAREKGIPTEVAFFGVATAQRLKAAGVAPQLMAANNVLAHVPELNDFVAGFAVLLAPGGVLTVEFPHLLRLMRENQFDTIYHEHFSYFSLLTVQRIFAAHGLRVFDVQQLPTHGGSLRVFVTQGDAPHAEMPAVAALLAEERAAGLEGRAAYAAFAAQVVDTKAALMAFCVEARRAGKTILGYGAPAKGATLLNSFGIGPALVQQAVERNPMKVGLAIPGCRIPIALEQDGVSPDAYLVLAWNFIDEFLKNPANIAFMAGGGEFIVPVPKVLMVGAGGARQV
jgi:SAM-dependent methyltransferase